MSDDPAATRPLRIGVSARLLYKVPTELGFRNKTLQYLEHSIAHWIMEHGAISLMIPAVTVDTRRVARHLSANDWVESLDGLVLQGGTDVSPQTYGQQALDPEWAGDPVRDRYELELLHAFLRGKKPVLGICRGAQLMNVAFGGTLYQDLLTQRPNTHAHVDAGLYDQLEHEVTLEAGSSLAKLYPGMERLRVTSIHHQAVDRLGRDLVIEARSTLDGVVEAIRWTGAGYARGFQWHGEFHHDRRALADSSPIMLDFLNAARDAAGELRAVGRHFDTREPRPPLLMPYENVEPGSTASAAAAPIAPAPAAGARVTTP
jgi:putative glutamine amidotransferase